jgi:hypothetical protein
MARKKIEDAQRNEIARYHKNKLKPKHPKLILIVIENNGYNSIVTEPSHPDLLWSYHAEGEVYWLYHELKKSDGKLDKGQIDWWDKFKETKYCKGVITQGWEAHLKGLHDWLSTLPKNN